MIGEFVFTSSGVIGNVKECESLSIPISYTITGTIIHKEWELIGDLPVGLEFKYDNNNPIIIGNIKMFMKQNKIPPNDFYPKEDLKFDGSNRMNTGDYRYASFSFDFSIKHLYTSIDDITTTEEDKEAITNLTIILNHLDNKQNTMFIKNYLDNDETDTYMDILTYDGYNKLVLVTKPREIPYDGKVYKRNDVDELLRNHPGPFSTCQGD